MHRNLPPGSSNNRIRPTLPSQSNTKQAVSNNLYDKPNNNNNAISNSNNNGALNRPPVVDRPIRERIIHLLAIKPYSKPELMLKLSKNNPLNDKEKESLDSILQSVGILNKTNQFELANEIMLNEVKEEWQFYNQNEKIQLKKNMLKAKQAQLTQSTFSSGTNSTNSSSNSGAKQPLFVNTISSLNQTKSSAFASISKQSHEPKKSPLTSRERVTYEAADVSTDLEKIGARHSFEHKSSKDPKQ